MFYEISFPLVPDYGLSGGTKFNTVLNQSQGGNVTPQSMWDTPLLEFDIECESITQASYDLVKAWFLLMRGKNKGCRFQDPSDYTGTNEYIGVGDGSTTEWQLVKNYIDTYVPYAIVRADGTGEKLTIKDADEDLLGSGSIIYVSGSTSNNGFYTASAVASQSYTVAGYSGTTYTITGNYTAEFTINQKVIVTHGGTEYTRYVKSITWNDPVTELELKSAVSGGAASDTIAANTVVTVSPDLVDETADGYVWIFHSRDIVKPVESEAVAISVNSVAKTEGSDYDVDYTTGIITFDAAPTDQHRIVATAFEFDVPIILKTDKLDTTFESFERYSFDIPVIEWRNPS